jgi:3-deoxy-D-manno-octulosonate 8-phosphate phosphatase (KDO 8-P phosphatase)
VQPMPAIQTPAPEILRAIRLVVFDFDGVFTDNAVYVFQDGTEAVRCSRSDGIGLRALERVGISPLILSAETNPVVTARANKLRVRCVQGVDDKLSALQTLAAEMQITMQEIAYVGNDVNDAECLRAVRLPIVVRDAHEDVVPLALYQTRKNGGDGAVREVCDLFARAYRV